MKRSDSTSPTCALGRPIGIERDLLFTFCWCPALQNGWRDTPGIRPSQWVLAIPPLQTIVLHNLGMTVPAIVGGIFQEHQLSGTFYQAHQASGSNMVIRHTPGSEPLAPGRPTQLDEKPGSV